MISLLST